MDRRHFLTNGIATGLATPVVLGPTSALAVIKEDEDSDEDAFKRVSLLLTPRNRVVLLTQLLIYANGLLLFYDLQRMWNYYPASRASLGGVPLLGALQHQPVEKRVNAMELVGTVFLVSTTLIMMASRMPRRKPKRVTVFNGGNEFTTTSRAKTVKQEQFDRILKPAKEIRGSGMFYDQDTGELLAKIPPEFIQR